MKSTPELHVPLKQILELPDLKVLAEGNPERKLSKVFCCDLFCLDLFHLQFLPIFYIFLLFQLITFRISRLLNFLSVFFSVYV